MTTATPFTITLGGASGRMGSEVLHAIAQHKDMTIAQALVDANSPYAGEAVTHPHFSEYHFDTQLNPNLPSQAMVVFALPDASMKFVSQARAAHMPVVMCSTGFSENQMQQLDNAAQSIPILVAPNTSVGIFWLGRLASRLASALPLADIEIIESHHRDKVDAPSGTALYLGARIAQARGVRLDDVCENNRNGAHRARVAGSIGFASLRLGGVVGEHKILFGLDGETIELSHKAISRQTFAQGALTLAQWIVGQPPGLYRIEDALTCNAHE